SRDSQLPLPNHRPVAGGEGGVVAGHDQDGGIGGHVDVNDSLDFHGRQVGGVGGVERHSHAPFVATASHGHPHAATAFAAAAAVPAWHAHAASSFHAASSHHATGASAGAGVEFKRLTVL